MFSIRQKKHWKINTKAAEVRLQPGVGTGTHGCPCSAGQGLKPCATAWNKQCGAAGSGEQHAGLPKALWC